MDLTAHVTAIGVALEDLAGDDEATQTAHRMATALAPALQLQLLDLLGEVALEVSEQLPDGRLDLQLAGRDAVLVYRADPAAEQPAPVEDGAETARLTVRMPDSLKSAIEAAAETAGVSINSWLVAAARRQLSPTTGSNKPPVSTNRRITGYIQG